MGTILGMYVTRENINFKKIFIYRIQNEVLEHKFFSYSPTNEKNGITLGEGPFLPRRPLESPLVLDFLIIC